MNQSAALLQPGDEVSGFKVARVERINEIRATAYEARHAETGARFLHLHCEDPENLYAITFRTPPPDDTGVAHILEHSVLAGSKRFPLKDVFNELSRGTLKTFINAFTGRDFTCYPVSSQVRADFYNLASVYTDLVLRPLLAKNTFLREGHHLEIDAEGALSISGIVYNEMKGAFSTPERVSASMNLETLFAGSPYQNESGGKPEAIPGLTYTQFCDFHRRYYSPTNARFFFYGNLPPADHLAFLGEQLAGFRHVTVDSAVPDTERWAAPREAQVPYPIGADDPLEKRTVVDVTWLTASGAELDQRLILEVLQEALVGNAAAPLRKALIDSGLGEDLSPNTGLVTWMREMPFTIGLRGTGREQAAAIETLALDTLREIVSAGLPGDQLEAAIHQVEFKGQEIKRDRMPFGINLLFRTLNTWLHDADALLPLTFPTLMAQLRARWDAKPRLFEEAIVRWLIDNPHRLRLTTFPSRTLASEQAGALGEELRQRGAAMTAAETEALREQGEALREDQRRQDTPEQRATLPRLELAQIPREIETIPTARMTLADCPVYEHDLFANGITYVDLAFDVGDIPEHLQLYLPLLCAAASGMGAAGEDYGTFATRKALTTGGIDTDLLAQEALAGEGALLRLTLRGSALKRNLAPLVAILRDILVSGDLSDADRLADLISEERNQMRAAVAPGGHMFSARSAAAGQSDAAWRREQWRGVTQIRFLGEMQKRFAADPAEVQGKLAQLRELVLRRGRVALNLTGERDALDALRAPLTELLEALPAEGAAGPAVRPDRRPRNIGVAIPGEVTYVTRALRAPRYTEALAPTLWVLASYLKSGYLYKKIRVEGGAYGGFCQYNPLSGLFTFLSYRDPHLERTLATYDGTHEAFLAQELDAEELRTTIIGAMSTLEPPLDPAGKGWQAFMRQLLGIQDEDRQRFRAAVLGVSAADLRVAAAEVIGKGMAGAPQAVYGPRERIEAANKTLPRGFEIESLG